MDHREQHFQPPLYRTSNEVHFTGTVQRVQMYWDNMNTSKLDHKFYVLIFLEKKPAEGLMPKDFKANETE